MNQHFLDKIQVNSLIEKAENLESYQENLNTIIQKSKEILDKCYEDGNFEYVTKYLNDTVKELLSIQNEIKAHFKNIRSIICQINAVRLNIKDQKRKLKVVKNEERRAEMTLAAEMARRDEREESLALLPRSKRIRINVAPVEKVNDERNPISRTPKRNFIGPRSKISRQPKQRSNGTDVSAAVTLLLNPIQELQNQNSDNSDTNASISGLPASTSSSNVVTDLTASNSQLEIN